MLHHLGDEGDHIQGRCPTRVCTLSCFGVLQCLCRLLLDVQFHIVTNITLTQAQTWHVKAVSAICWGSVDDFRRCLFPWLFWIIIHYSASHYYYSNSSIDLTFEFSKCYLLGQFELTESTECNWSCAAMGIQLRPPQRKTLMILSLISASLWGCLGCQIFIKSTESDSGYCFDWLWRHFETCLQVTIITPAWALTWLLYGVSATCWGSCNWHKVNWMQ